jgi:hypothetical protein
MSRVTPVSFSWCWCDPIVRPKGLLSTEKVGAICD